MKRQWTATIAVPLMVGMVEMNFLTVKPAGRGDCESEKRCLRFSCVWVGVRSSSWLGSSIFLCDKLICCNIFCMIPSRPRRRRLGSGGVNWDTVISILKTNLCCFFYEPLLSSTIQFNNILLPRFQVNLISAEHRRPIGQINKPSYELIVYLFIYLFIRQLLAF